jgi:hypothetical protein
MPLRLLHRAAVSRSSASLWELSIGPSRATLSTSLPTRTCPWLWTCPWLYRAERRTEWLALKPIFYSHYYAYSRRGQLRQPRGAILEHNEKCSQVARHLRRPIHSDVRDPSFGFATTSWRPTIIVEWFVDESISVPSQFELQYSCTMHVSQDCELGSLNSREPVPIFSPKRTFASGAVLASIKQRRSRAFCTDPATSA